MIDDALLTRALADAAAAYDEPDGAREAILAAAAEELAEIVRELRARPVRPRTAHQPPEVQARNREHRAVPQFLV